MSEQSIVEEYSVGPTGPMKDGDNTLPEKMIYWGTLTKEKEQENIKQIKQIMLSRGNTNDPKDIILFRERDQKVVNTYSQALQLAYHELRDENMFQSIKLNEHLTTPPISLTWLTGEETTKDNLKLKNDIVVLGSPAKSTPDQYTAAKLLLINRANKFLEQTGHEALPSVPNQTLDPRNA